MKSDQLLFSTDNISLNRATSSGVTPPTEIRYSVGHPSLFLIDDRVSLVMYDCNLLLSGIPFLTSYLINCHKFPLCSGMLADVITIDFFERISRCNKITKITSTTNCDGRFNLSHHRAKVHL